MKTLLAATVAPSLVAQIVVPPQSPSSPPAPGPVPWMQGLDQAHLDSVATLTPEEVGQAGVTYFSSPEMATLTRLADLLVPALRGKPGAIAAGVPSFLDFFVGQSVGEVQRMYREGLDWLDVESVRQIQLHFVQLSPEQAGLLIRPYLKTWMPDHYPAEAHERFLNAAHHDIRMATVNSQAWADASGGERYALKDIYWSPVDPGVRGQSMPVAPPTAGEAGHSL